MAHTGRGPCQQMLLFQSALGWTPASRNSCVKIPFGNPPPHPTFSKHSGMNSWKWKHLHQNSLWKSSSPPRFFKALWDELLKTETSASKLPFEIPLPHPPWHTQTSLSWANLSFALVPCYSLWDKHGGCSWIGHSLWRGPIHTGPWFVTLALAEVAEVTGSPELRIESRQDTLLTMHSSGAVWESRWTSWAVRPNEPSGFRGYKDLLHRASALVTTCH